MQQRSRGRHLVALVNDVLPTCSQKQQDQPDAVDLPTSPSVISDTDEEIFSPPKKKSTVVTDKTAIANLITNEDVKKKPNMCRKLFKEKIENRSHPPGSINKKVKLFDTNRNKLQASKNIRHVFNSAVPIPIDVQNTDQDKEYEIHPLPESLLDQSPEKMYQHKISPYSVDVPVICIIPQQQKTSINKENTCEKISSGQLRDGQMVINDEQKQPQVELQEELQEEIQEELQEEVQEEVQEKVLDELQNKSQEKLQEELLEEIQEVLQKELQEELQKELQEELQNELQEELQKELQEELQNEPQANLHEEARAGAREDPQEVLPEERGSQNQPNRDPIDEFWERENIYDGKKRKPRRSLKESRKDRMERSNLRNTGQVYITTSGKTIRARSMKELDDCRMKCKERISDLVREHFYKYYWTLGNYVERVDFVKGLIEPGKKKSAQILETKVRNRVFSNKYFLKFAGDCFPICRGCLSKTLDETSKFLQTATKKKQMDTGMDNGEIKRRGGKKKTSLLQLEEAKKHILSFPAFESHYARSQTKKKYLPSDLNLSTMYKLYTTQCENKPVCLTTYTHIFRGQNISFKKPKIDTCSTCDALNAKIKVAENENNTTSIADLNNELVTHQMLAEKAYKDKDSDKKRAADTNDILVATFDLQQCLPTPFLRSGVAFYKRQLWTYNLTIHVCNENKVYCYMWHEGSGARGGNQIASCVYHFICNFVGEDIKHLIFYSDSCAGQNKNNHVIAMILTAIKKAPNLQSIEHKFLVPGHTHLECDADHALIEKAKRKTNLDIHVPRDWFQLVRSVSKKKTFQVIEMTHDSFHNFSSLLKSEFTVRKTNEQKEKFLFAEVSEFKFDKALFPKVMYKKRKLEEEQYKTIDYTKWGRKTYKEDILPTPCYTDTLPISEEKMKDLKSLFPYIDKEAQEFYSSLKSDSSIATIDPDLEDRAQD